MTSVTLDRLFLWIFDEAIWSLVNVTYSLHISFMEGILYLLRKKQTLLSLFRIEQRSDQRRNYEHFTFVFAFVLYLTRLVLYKPISQLRDIE